MRLRLLGALGVAAAMVLAGCSNKEEPVPEASRTVAPGQQPEMPPSHPPLGGQEGQPPMAMNVPSQKDVVVPDDVRETWKAVVLEVGDKVENTSEDLTVDIGDTATVGGLEITVDSFLPAFTMGGGVFTSSSNNTENPAARILVKEEGQEIFAGFIFSMHPGVHPFEHEKHSILLKDFVKK